MITTVLWFMEDHFHSIYIHTGTREMYWRKGRGKKEKEKPQTCRSLPHIYCGLFTGWLFASLRLDISREACYGMAGCHSAAPSPPLLVYRIDSGFCLDVNTFQLVRLRYCYVNPQEPSGPHRVGFYGQVIPLRCNKPGCSQHRLHNLQTVLANSIYS